MTTNNSRFELWKKYARWVREGTTEDRQAAYKMMSNLDAIVGPREDEEEMDGEECEKK